MLGGLCNEPLINMSLIWRDKPQFTECFQYTVESSNLLFLLIFIVQIFYYAKDYKRKLKINRPLKFMLEVLLTLILLVLHVVDIIIVKKYHGIDVQPIYYCSASIMIGTLFCYLLVSYLNWSSCCLNNTADYLFWFINIAAIIPRTYSLTDDEKSYDYMDWRVSIVSLHLILSFIIILLKSFTYKVKPRNQVNCQKVNPEPYASVSSAWTFNWLNSIIGDAYKKRIETVEDLYKVRPSESVEENYEKFNEVWSRSKPVNTLIAFEKKKENQEETDETSLLQSEEIDEEAKLNQDKIMRKGMGAFVYSIAYSFAKYVVLGWVLLLIQGIMLYLSPVLMSRMMRYLNQEKSSPAWIGYSISFGFLMITIVTVFPFHRGFFMTYNVGTRVRAALTATIYKKALRLSAESRKLYSAGELVTLLTVDINHIVQCCFTLHWIIIVIFQLIVAIILLWGQMGIATLAGIALIIVSIPINILSSWLCQRFEKKELETKDKRLKLLGEMFSGIRILKLYAWERAFEKSVLAIRRLEVSYLFKNLIGFGVIQVTWCIFPYLILLVTILSFISKMMSSPVDDVAILTPERIFVSLTLFSLIRLPLLLLPWSANILVMAFVSVKRLARFLITTELDDNSILYLEDKPKEDRPAITLKSAAFSWSPNAACILNDINLVVPKKGLVAVVGPVGSGKSSLLSALLGDMHKRNGTAEIRGEVAYVPQSAWIQQHSVRGNIVFGSHYEEHWYTKVVTACALTTDIARMDNGSDTLIGEKGVNISGGQKQRINVARAVYQCRDVYLLDDPLSAVDSHVAKHIFENVIGPNGVLSGCTRLVVTNSFNFLPQFDMIIVLREGGQIVQRGKYEELLQDENGYLSQYILQSKNKMESETNENNATPVIPIKTRTTSITVDEQRSYNQNIGAAFARSPPKVFAQPPVSMSCSPGTSGFLFNHSQRGLLGISPADDCPSPILPADNVGVKDFQEQAVRRRIKTQSTSAHIDLISKNRNEIRFEGNTPAKDINPVNPGTLQEVRVDDSLDQNNNTEGEGHPVIGETIKEEFMENSGVSYKSYWDYLLARGVILTIMTVLFFACFQTAEIFSSYWLQWFADDKDLVSAAKKMKDPHTDRKEKYKLMELIQHISLKYLYGYCYVGIGLFFMACTYISIMNISLKMASTRIHARMLGCILKAPCSFFDVTPVGRILNRFSDDLDIVDHTFPSSTHEALTTLLNFIACMLVVFLNIRPIWVGLIVIIPMTVVCVILQKLYLPCSRQARRLFATSKSPILTCFSETAASSLGSVMLRTFNKVPSFNLAMNKLINKNSSAWFVNYSTNRWFDVRLELVGGIFVFFTATFIVMNRADISPGLAGLMLSYALQCSEALIWLTKNTADVENSAVSIERIKEYSEVKQEADWDKGEDSPVPSDWPRECSEIELRDTCIYYEGNEKPALNHLNIKLGGSSSDRVIGIVGRTGAGKTTLAASLFRMVELSGPNGDPEGGGAIVIDGVNISRIGLHELRSRLSILPQEPVIFSGSLRFNLDPFNRLTDHQIWAALRDAHLFDWATKHPDGLQFECGEGGANMSAGQRQLLCLARVFLSSKGNIRLLVLDEATSAMDPVTDQLVMNSVLSDRFQSAIVIIIAHRLSTVVDADKILVMEDGNIVEAGNPRALLKDPHSRFAKMSNAHKE